MTVDFLFIIPTTTSSADSEIRKELRKLCFQQILKVKASKKVWLLGPSDEVIPGFETIPLTTKSKDDKLFEAGFLLEKEPDMARYLIRMDDDDLINPEVLDTLIKGDDFDSFCDRTHWFYDLSSGRTSRQERPWMPKVTVHKMKHALVQVKSEGGSPLSGDSNFLFACDHSKAWHRYYTDRKVQYADSDKPLYLRMIMPRSKYGGGDDTYQEKYAHHLQRFGNWKSAFPYGEQLLTQLKEIWISREGDLRLWSFPKKSFVSRFLNKIKSSK